MQPPIAYTYDAAMHCPPCAIGRFGEEPRHRCAVCHEREASHPWEGQHAYGPLADHDYQQSYLPFPPYDAVDSEGNPLGAVAPWDDWCGQCGQDDPVGRHSEDCDTCGRMIASHDCNTCGEDHRPGTPCGACNAVYPGAVTWEDGSAILCNDTAGHPGSHGNSLANRWWSRKGMVTPPDVIALPAPMPA